MVEKYNLNSINTKVIYKVLLLIRKSIAEYLKEVYFNPMAEKNKNEIIAIDESLFCHYKDTQKIWVIGLCNTRTEYFRTEVVLDRTTETIKKIIKHHIEKGNTIVTDGWSAYDWLDNNNSGYQRIPHIHGHHDFGYGSESTSYIESVWSDLKRLLNKFYNAVKPDNFIYFLKEMEWRKKVSKFSNAQKINNLIMIFNHIASTTEYNLLDKEMLENYDKGDYNNDSNEDNEEEDEQASENDDDAMDIEL